MEKAYVLRRDVNLPPNSKPVEEGALSQKEYKKKYYKLIHSMGMIQGQMCNRCPFVKSCCGGCKTLKETLSRIKNEDSRQKWEYMNNTLKNTKNT